MTDKNNKYGFRFRDWDIYKDSRQLRIYIHKSFKKFPPDERYSLTDQTRRALDSIILNIAEESNRNTDKDTKLYITRSRCSLDEVVSCMDCTLDSNYISKEEHCNILDRADILAKKLNGFTVHLSKGQ